MNTIRVQLREAMERYRRRTGERLTYEKLSAMSGVSRPTLEAIGSREDYNPTLATVEKICTALGSSLAELLEMSAEDVDPGRK